MGGSKTILVDGSKAVWATLGSVCFMNREGALTCETFSPPTAFLPRQPTRHKYNVLIIIVYIR